MFLFLWNFILRALYINKVFSSWWSILRGREKNVISNVIPFAEEQMVFVCGASRKFYTLKLLLYSRLSERNVVLAPVEHPRLCPSWCQCVLKPAEMWGYPDPLSLCLYNVDCSQVQARVACLEFILCSTLARVVLSEVTVNDFEFLHLYLCLLRLDSCSFQVAALETVGDQSPGDARQLLQHPWAAHHHHHSWFSALNLMPHWH